MKKINPGDTAVKEWVKPSLYLKLAHSLNKKEQVRSYMEEIVLLLSHISFLGKTDSETISEKYASFTH